MVFSIVLLPSLHAIQFCKLPGPVLFDRNIMAWSAAFTQQLAGLRSNRASLFTE
jgi:hypothetical protein